MLDWLFVQIGHKCRQRIGKIVEETKRNLWIDYTRVGYTISALGCFSSYTALQSISFPTQHATAAYTADQREDTAGGD
ncbi:MAG: hypothetical protein AAFN93_19610 [Bacteroidota bacterium]